MLSGATGIECPTCFMLSPSTSYQFQLPLGKSRPWQLHVIPFAETLPQWKMGTASLHVAFVVVTAWTNCNYVESTRHHFSHSAMKGFCIEADTTSLICV